MKPLFEWFWLHFGFFLIALGFHYIFEFSFMKSFACFFTLQGMWIVFFNSINVYRDHQ